MSLLTTIIIPRKAKLLVELEISAPNTTVGDNGSDNHRLEEDLECELDKRMQEMITVHERMFSDAESNIKDAQARYKRDYDRKRSQCEVKIYLIVKFSHQHHY